MNRVNKTRSILIGVGLFLIALGFYLSIYSVTKMVTYSIGITLPDLIYPYRIEGLTIGTIGPIIFWFGINFDGSVKSKKELIKKIL